MFYATRVKIRLKGMKKGCQIIGLTALYVFCRLEAPYAIGACISSVAADSLGLTL